MIEPVDLRLLQANERTLLAWVRTGLALIAFGFVVARLAFWLRAETHGESGEDALVALGSATIALGAGCQMIGAGRFVLARRALLARRPVEPGALAPVAVALLVAGVGIAILLYLRAI